MDLSRWLERHALFTPGKLALRGNGRELSYAELDRRVRAAARALKHGLGVGRGDRVAFLGHNHPDFLVLLFAAARLGVIVVPLNWRLAVPEHGFMLADAGVELLFATGPFLAQAREVAGTLPCCRVVAVDGEGTPEEPDLNSLARAMGDDANPLVGPEAPLLLVYTSGTTGTPKGAVLRQAALFWNALNSLHMHELTSRDHVLTMLPLFHVGGLNIQTVPALYAGATVTLLERFEPGAVLEAIERFRPSLTVLVPATMQALMDHPRWAAADLSSLRMIACGSQVVPLHQLRAFHARGIPAAQVYGSTETCPIAAYQRAEDAPAKEGATGRPALHAELRIVGADGAELPAGMRGEVLVRSPSVMLEYWGNEAATAEALREGWFHTGDVGYLDEEGDLWIVDRKKDVIISGGENVYPAELEAVLLASSRINEAVVVAGPHPRWGEIPVAVVVPADRRLDEVAVLAMFEGRLARFKHPREVRFVDALPRNAMGKVLRYRVREMLRGA